MELYPKAYDAFVLCTTSIHKTLGAATRILICVLWLVHHYSYRMSVAQREKAFYFLYIAT